MSHEIWKCAAGCEPWYEVSNYGNVRSIDHVDRMGRFRKGKMLFQILDGKRNYLTVMIKQNGRFNRVSVHRIIAETFIDNPLNLPEVNHKDENKKNNRVDNLEWCDHSYNNNYGRKSYCTKGENNPMAKITPDQVIEIRKKRVQGLSVNDIANIYGLATDHVYHIIERKIWRWLNEDDNL